MRILTMVLSYGVSPFYELMKAQGETWADGDTVFYLGSSAATDVAPRSTLVLTGATDSYYYMHGKFKKALEWIWNEEWDMIFRTNSSSYVNIPKLNKFAQKLPKEKLYAGWTIEDSNDHGGLCVSGAGIWLSRDTAEILKNEIDPNTEMEEDVLCGRILRKNGITAIDDQSRVDYPYKPQYWDKAYHVRFKTEDRLRDAENMRHFHKKIINA